MNSRLKKEYKSQFKELRRIINSWNLIPDSPDDEFDSINHLILSQLYKGADHFKLSKALYHELSINYGLSVEMQDMEKIVPEVMDWWNGLN